MTVCGGEGGGAVWVWLYACGCVCVCGGGLRGGGTGFLTLNDGIVTLVAMPCYTWRTRKGLTH